MKNSQVMPTALRLLKALILRRCIPDARPSPLQDVLLLDLVRLSRKTRKSSSLKKRRMQNDPGAPQSR